MTKAKTIAEELYLEPVYSWGEFTVIEFAVKVAEKYLESQLKPQEREECNFCDGTGIRKTGYHDVNDFYKD